MVALSTKARPQADKQISILAVMAKLGKAPLGCAAGGNHYFLSPFREEATPSFVVCEPKNVWTDFGEEPEPGQKAAGGDVLKLVMKLTGFELPLARLTLRAWAADLATPGELLAAPRGQTITTGKITFEDVRTEPLTWAALIQYLTGRGINWGLVQQSNRTQAHLYQIFYRIRGDRREKPYFALAWKTAAGFEVRNKRFQGTIGGKGLTWLPGRHSKEVVVFEGFFDYLSALTYYGKSSFESTVLVLNSASLLVEALPQLLAFEKVHWMGDNDMAGERALRLLRQAMPAKVVAHNELYRGYKDFNDFLTKTPPSKPLPPKRAEPSKLSQTSEYWLWVVFQERAPGTPEAAGMQRKCTFYGYTNDGAGLDYLRVLRNRLGNQLAYYRLCQRTHGRQYRILEWAGHYQPLPLPRPASLPDEPEC